MRLHTEANPREGLNVLPGEVQLLPDVKIPVARHDKCQCGAMLSRYNPGSVCGPCQRRERY